MTVREEAGPRTLRGIMLAALLIVPLVAQAGAVRYLPVVESATVEAGSDCMPLKQQVDALRLGRAIGEDECGRKGGRCHFPMCWTAVDWPPAAHSLVQVGEDLSEQGMAGWSPLSLSFRGSTLRAEGVRVKLGSPADLQGRSLICPHVGGLSDMVPGQETTAFTNAPDPTVMKAHLALAQCCIKRGVHLNANDQGRASWHQLVGTKPTADDRFFGFGGFASSRAETFKAVKPASKLDGWGDGRNYAAIQHRALPGSQQDWSGGQRMVCQPYFGAKRESAAAQDRGHRLAALMLHTTVRGLH